MSNEKNFKSYFDSHFCKETRFYLVMPVICSLLTMVGLHDLREPISNLDTECKGVVGITLHLE